MRQRFDQAKLSAALAVQPTHVVLGTAGHIDHGKTSLIRALTGVDTDRLPEEKKRGITIVLGFAPLDLPDGRRIGVIDVPGHERFVKNMVAGAGGVDFVLLVVAADEGVMPQTREHIEICEMLGVDRGMVALTKIDKAGEELTELAIDDVSSYLEGSTLEGIPIVPCSSITGEGIDEVRQQIAALASATPPRPESEIFVLPVDRAFSVKGFGTVVTGTLLSGSVSAGDKVEIQPAILGRPPPPSIRVRSAQVFHEQVPQALAGDRTAVSLQGVDLDQVTRGQLVTTPGVAQTTRAIDAHIRYLSSRPKALKTGAQTIFHVGTAIVNAALTLLDTDRLQPGEAGFARIRLQEPVATYPGQRFILRGFEAVTTAGRTVGGGRVLDPKPPRRRRHDPRALTVLEALQDLHDATERPTPDAAITAMATESGHQALDVGALATRLGRPRSAIDKSVARSVKARRICRIGDLIIENDAVTDVGARIIEILGTIHEEQPFRAGVPIAELSTRLGRKVASQVASRAASQLKGAGKLQAGPDGYHLPGHQPFGGGGSAAREAVLDALATAGLAPPSLSGLETASGLKPKALKELLSTLTRTGDVIKASASLYFGKQSFERARDELLDHIESAGELTTADAKAKLDISRKYLIPLLETLDRLQITVRVGEVRKAKNPRSA